MKRKDIYLLGCMIFMLTSIWRFNPNFFIALVFLFVAVIDSVFENKGLIG